MGFHCCIYNEPHTTWHYCPTRGSTQHTLHQENMLRVWCSRWHRLGRVVKVNCCVKDEAPSVFYDCRLFRRGTALFPSTLRKTRVIMGSFRCSGEWSSWQTANEPDICHVHHLKRSSGGFRFKPLWLVDSSTEVYIYIYIYKGRALGTKESFSPTERTNNFYGVMCLSVIVSEMNSSAGNGLLCY